MIDPGDTIVGLDMGGHIWVVLSRPTANDEIAIVSLSKHGRPKHAEHSDCTVVRQAEYSELYSDSCVMLRSAILNPLRPLLASQQRGELMQRAPIPASILRRVRRAVLDYRFTSDAVRQAISATLEAADSSDS